MSPGAVATQDVDLQLQGVEEVKGGDRTGASWIAGAVLERLGLELCVCVCCAR